MEMDGLVRKMEVEVRRGRGEERKWY